MKLAYCLIFVLFTSYIEAQEIDSVLLRIHYASKFKMWDTNKNLSEDEHILDIGKKTSKFYSLWETRNEEIRDSVLAQGGTFQDVQNALGKADYPRSYQYYEVYKNYPEKGKITYTDKEFKNYIYEETLEKPQWKILVDEKAIAGYRCQKALTNFRGRTWFAWFTIDIPISDGPWKLCGLPGLILKAEDKKGEFFFECIELKNMDKGTIKFPKRKYIRCSRESLKQIMIKSIQDPVGYFRQLGIETNTGVDANGQPLKYGDKMPVFLED